MAAASATPAATPAASLSATERASRVKLMIFDVDGVLTDGSLLFTAEGDTMKSFSSMDGHGVKLLREAGIETAIITGRKSGIVAARAKELRITHLYQGVDNKPQALAELLAQTGLDPDACGYMGDDWIDLGVMLKVGFAAAPANAHPEVIARAHWVSEARGGHGAVREVCDTLLRAQHRYDALLAAACRGGEQQGLTG
jgi:3-deoxy-D-manno-octulosonate 8-phosphate phosphatase (KDO 8-P phosphatase)